MRVVRPIHRVGRLCLTLLCLSWFVPAQEAAPPLNKTESLKAHYVELMARMRADFDAKISGLQDEIAGLRGDLNDAMAEERDHQLRESVDILLREAQAGQHIAGAAHGEVLDEFSPLTFSLRSDMVLAVSDQSDTYEDLDQVILRALELAVEGQVDENLSYVAVLHFDEEDVEIDEAYGVWGHNKSGSFSLKAGRYRVDYGQLSPLHDHELPFVDRPQVLQEYLGGSLVGTGLELHHRTTFSEGAALRWSAGVVNRLDGESHAIFGPVAGDHDHDEEVEPFGKRHLKDFGYTARVATLFDIGTHATFQFGGSVAWAPRTKSFYLDPMSGAIRYHDLDRLVLGSDLALKWRDHDTGRGVHFGAEFLWSRADSAGEDAFTSDVSSVGLYAYGEYFLDQRWSLGMSGGWYEHAEDSSEDSWDLGSFVTWQLNPSNRLRLEVRRFDDPAEQYWGAMLQWTVVLGHHHHHDDW